MVQDPSIREIWGAALLLGLFGYSAARFRRWLVIPALALIAILAWTELGGLLEPRVGADIMRDPGVWHVAQAGAAGALAVILCVLGLAPKRSV